MIVNIRQPRRAKHIKSIRNLMEILMSAASGHRRKANRPQRKLVRISLRLQALIGASIVAFDCPMTIDFAQAETLRGAAMFPSERHCAASGKLSAEMCANAAANAAAEFDEKAPRLPTRAACERLYGPCSLGFRGADGWAGRRNSVYFTPQRHGFRVVMKSDNEATVVPVARGLSFAARSATRRDAMINPKARREHASSGQQELADGVGAPDGVKGPPPPPPPVDPNFDCAAVLEPSDKGDPESGCYLAPARRR